jgi:hypothetical protein
MGAAMEKPQPPKSEAPRAPYEKPELKEFGTIASLTATNAIGKFNDGATKGNDKSGL